MLKEEELHKVLLKEVEEEHDITSDNYLTFNRTAGLKARLYQKNKELMNGVLNDKENDTGTRDLLDYLGINEHGENIEPNVVSGNSTIPNTTTTPTTNGDLNNFDHNNIEVIRNDDTIDNNENTQLKRSKYSHIYILERKSDTNVTRNRKKNKKTPLPNSSFDINSFSPLDIDENDENAMIEYAMRMSMEVNRQSGTLDNN